MLMPCYLIEHLQHLLGALSSSFADVDHGMANDSSQAEPAEIGDSATELQQLGGATVHVNLLNNNNSQYYGDFSLGSPKERFTAIFDTGSGITWVPGTKCTSDTCLEHHRFAGDPGVAGKVAHDLAVSSHAKNGWSGNGVINYGTGKVNYESGVADLTFCDSHTNIGCQGDHERAVVVPHQPVGMSTDQTSYPFRILPFDGILGLSPSSNWGSVMHQLKTAKALARNVFGVYLSKDTHRSGSITFGGVEHQYVAPDSQVHWHKIVNPREWRLEMKDILVDGKPLHVCDSQPDGICPTIVDTGSSLLTGPTGDVEKLLREIPTDSSCSGLHKMPEVSLQLVDHQGKTVSYPLTPDEYTLHTQEEVPDTGKSDFWDNFPLLGKGGTSPEVHDRCDPGIGVLDVPGRKWILGDTFLRRYYSIFDDDRHVVGLVRSLHPEEPLPVTTAPSSAPASMAAQAANLEGIAKLPTVAESTLGYPMGVVAPMLLTMIGRSKRISKMASFI